MASTSAGRVRRIRGTPGVLEEPNPPTPFPQEGRGRKPLPAAGRGWGGVSTRALLYRAVGRNDTSDVRKCEAFEISGVGSRAEGIGTTAQFTAPSSPNADVCSIPGRVLGRTRRDVPRRLSLRAGR